MSDFYRAFEDKYRGSRETIINRLRAYEDLLRAVKQQNDTTYALDLGCGRGEWLQLLSGLGIQAKGVDLDNGMLSACEELGFDVVEADLFAYLKDVDDYSLDILSAFHVIEHIPFELLQILMQEANRVLKPGGLLILETPNPENISVASNSFHLDPTHSKPLPPDLMKFLAEYYGYGQSMIYRLDNFKTVESEAKVSLADVLMFVSPDYALVATTKTDNKESQATLSLFAQQENGHSLDKLVKQWDWQQLEQEKQIALLQGLQQQLVKTQDHLFEAKEFQRKQLERLERGCFYRLVQRVGRIYHKVKKNKLEKPDSFSPSNLGNLVKTVLQTLKTDLKLRFKSQLWKLRHKLHQYPRLQRNVINLLEKVPFLSLKIRRLMHSVDSDALAREVSVPEELNRRSAGFYSQMKHMQKQNSNEDRV